MRTIDQIKRIDVVKARFDLFGSEDAEERPETDADAEASEDVEAKKLRRKRRKKKARDR